MAAYVPARADIVANALGGPPYLYNGGGTGQVIISTTGVAVTGPNLVAVNGVTVTAHPLNSAFSSTIGGTVGIGLVSNSVGGSGSGAFLQPGASLGFAVANAKYLCVNGVAGDKFSFAVS